MENLGGFPGFWVVVIPGNIAGIARVNARCVWLKALRFEPGLYFFKGPELYRSVEPSL